MRRPPPRPPFPDLHRTPDGAFGWLPVRLLHEGWLARLGSHGTSVLTLLALAADKHGSSFYSRDRMAKTLQLTRHEIDAALERIVTLQFAAFRPWREGHADGVWQLLAPPVEHLRARTRGPVGLREIIESIARPRCDGPDRRSDA